MWWKLSTIISCGTAAGALIPEFTKVFTSVNSKHVREIVDASREGGASLNVLSGLVAGNSSGYWLGLVITALMGAAYGVSTIGGLDHSVAQLLTPFTAPAVAVFAFGLVTSVSSAWGQSPSRSIPTAPSPTTPRAFTNLA